MSKQKLSLHKADHDPRAAALSALSAVLEGGADSQAAVDSAVRPASLAPSDKGLCTELVYGVLRRYLSLCAFSERFLTKPHKLPAEMRLALVCALYEMLFLRIPARAGFHWTVNHVRNRFGEGLACVANGALRSMQRHQIEFTAPPAGRFETAEERAAFMHSAPLWLVRLWFQQYGPEEAEALLAASAVAPPSGLRCNRGREGWEEDLRVLLEETEEGGTPPQALPPAAIFTDAPLNWRAKRLLREGRASRQSPASYSMLQELEPATWPLPLWDACSGRGGKTLALLEAGIPVALASDPAKGRLSGLPDEYARLGLSNPPLPTVLQQSATDALPENAGLPDSFGAVLVDAPCSGLGTLARRPEIRLRRTPEDLERLAVLQREILHAVWPRIRPGGRLVYLTCTRNRAENQDQTAAFLKEKPEARLALEKETPATSPFREFFYGAVIVKG